MEEGQGRGGTRAQGGGGRCVGGLSSGLSPNLQGGRGRGGRFPRGDPSRKRGGRGAARFQQRGATKKKRTTGSSRNWLSRRVESGSSTRRGVRAELSQNFTRASRSSRIASLKDREAENAWRFQKCFHIQLLRGRMNDALMDQPGQFGIGFLPLPKAAESRWVCACPVIIKGSPAITSFKWADRWFFRWLILVDFIWLK